MSYGPDSSITSGDSGTALPVTSKLARCREKWQRARVRASEAEAAVGNIDTALEATVARRTEFEIELAAARDRIALLQECIQAADSHCTKLRADRKSAAQDSAKAQRRARKVESRYDQAMLADLLSREKEHDLAAHPLKDYDRSTPDTSTVGVAASGTVTRSCSEDQI